MTPNPASPESKAKSPSPITTTPADLKNSGAFLEWANDTEPKESSARTGNVPSTKPSIISIPDIKDPLDSAATCID